MSVGQVINDLLAHVLILPSKSTRPYSLPGISHVGWAGAVMLKNRREKKGRMDRRTDGPTNQPMDTPSYRVAWT